MQDNGQPLAIDPAEAFRLIADFTYDWELWLGPGRELLYISPSCARISGYQPESFLADPGLLTAIVHPDDRDAFAQHLEHEFHDPEPLSPGVPHPHPHRRGALAPPRLPAGARRTVAGSW